MRDGRGDDRDSIDLVAGNEVAEVGEHVGYLVILRGCLHLLGSSRADRGDLPALGTERWNMDRHAEPHADDAYA